MPPQVPPKPPSPHPKPPGPHPKPPGPIPPTPPGQIQTYSCKNDNGTPKCVKQVGGMFSNIIDCNKCCTKNTIKYKNYSPISNFPKPNQNCIQSYNNISGVDVNNEQLHPPNTIQIVNSTSEDLNIFCQIPGIVPFGYGNGLKLYNYYGSWTINSKTPDGNILKKGEPYNWDPTKTIQSIQPDNNFGKSLGAPDLSGLDSSLYQQFTIKKGGYILLDILKIKDANGSDVSWSNIQTGNKYTAPAFRIFSVKLKKPTNDLVNYPIIDKGYFWKKNKVGSGVQTFDYIKQIPALFEGTPNAIADLSVVDGINYRIKMQVSVNKVSVENNNIANKKKQSTIPILQTGIIDNPCKGPLMKNFQVTNEPPLPPGPAMCNPNSQKPQMCPGNIKCPSCGKDACPCPSPPPGTPPPPPPPQPSKQPDVWGCYNPAQKFCAKNCKKNFTNDCIGNLSGTKFTNQSSIFCSAQMNQSCQLNKCSEKFWNMNNSEAIQLKNWGYDKHLDGGIPPQVQGQPKPKPEENCPNSKVGPVKNFIANINNLNKSQAMWPWCSSIHSNPIDPNTGININDGSTYCFDYDDATSSFNWDPPYKLKLNFYDLNC